MDQLVRAQGESGHDAVGVASPTVLGPGEHLIEVMLARTTHDAAMLRGLARVGFDIVLSDSAKTSGPARRFVGASRGRVALVDTPLVQWTYARTLPSGFGGFEEDDEPGSQGAAMAELERGRCYALRLLARVRTHPGPDTVSRALASTGFAVEILPLALRRGLVLPGRRTTVTRWLAFARWEGPSSYVTEEEPIYVERAVRA